MKRLLVRILPPKLAAALALLAITAQVAAISTGGVVCFRTSPFAAVDDCEHGCCDGARPAPPAAAFELPADDDCCVKQHVETPAPPAQGEINLAARALATPLMPSTVTSACPAHATCFALAANAHPPPALRSLRTTVLLV